MKNICVGEELGEVLEYLMETRGETEEELAVDLLAESETFMEAKRIIEARKQEEEGTETVEVLIVRPGEVPEKAIINKNLAAFQRVCNGNIEAVYFFDDPIAIICNEEGKLQGMKLNRALKDRNNNVIDVIAGTFFIMGLDNDNCDFASLTPELSEKYEQIFHNPENFLRLGEKLIAVPCPVEKQKA